VCNISVVFLDTVYGCLSVHCESRGVAAWLRLPGSGCDASVSVCASNAGAGQPACGAQYDDLAQHAR